MQGEEIIYFRGGGSFFRKPISKNIQMYVLRKLPSDERKINKVKKMEEEEMIKPSFYFKVIVPAMILLGLVTGAVLFGITDGLNRESRANIMEDRLCPNISQGAVGTAAELLSKQLCK